MPGILRTSLSNEEEFVPIMSQESPTFEVVTHDSESGIEDVGEAEICIDADRVECKCGKSEEEHLLCANDGSSNEIYLRPKSDIALSSHIDNEIAQISNCSCPPDLDIGTSSAPESDLIFAPFLPMLCAHRSGRNGDCDQKCRRYSDYGLQSPVQSNANDDHVLKELSQNEQKTERKPSAAHGGVDSHEGERKSSEKSTPLKFPSKDSPIHITPPFLSSYPNVKADKENDIPTDQSDAVDTDEDMNKKRVSGGSCPETIVCPDVASHHVGWEAMNTVYHIPIDILFTLLFTNSKFMLDLQTARKTYNVISSPWQSNPETNQKIRQVTYTMTLPTNSFGPKVSHVTETQVLSAFSDPGHIYTVDSEACNAGIPYADAFYVSNHWCLTSESPTDTRLTAWVQVKYKKNTWSFMKNVIDKNVLSGVETHMNDLKASLLLEVESTQKPSNKRRRRRAGSKTEGPELFSHVVADITKGSSFEPHKASVPPIRKMTLTPSSVDQTDVGYSWKKLTYLIIPVLVLLSLNAFLYYRLSDLDDRVFRRQDYGRPSPYSLHSLGLNLAAGGNDASLETWIQILQEQEALHLEEVQRWKSAVVEAADYLRKAEESLRLLQSSIPHQQASKIQTLLQHLHRLQSMKEAGVATDIKDSLSSIKSNIKAHGDHGDSNLNARSFGEKEKC